jgi:hypothetical protein
MDDLRFRSATGDASLEEPTSEGLPPPPPPSSEPPKQGWVRRTWAVVGIVGGFLFLIVPGIFAIRSYRRWRTGKVRRPIFAWTFAWITVAYVVFVAVTFATLPHELIDVDFRSGVEPFNLGQTPGALYDHDSGTYRITVMSTDFHSNTSVGEFVRIAYAVGVRAELVKMTEPGTSVGAMCLGPADGADGLVGYGFYVAPGGDFSLERQDPGGVPELLNEGTDPRIRFVDRVSIMCVPISQGNVSLIGFANGLEVVSAEDRDGYDVYSYAGLSVQTDTAMTEVRFTRVWARVPDDEWTP